MAFGAALVFFLTSSLDIGGRVGVAMPAGGLARSHNSTAAVNATLGYSFGRSRLGLDYGYAGFPGRQGSPYRLDVHEVLLGYGVEFVSRPGWGFEASLGAGLGFTRRSLYNAFETGTAPVGHVGIGWVQHENRSRLTVGLDNALHVESVSAASGRQYYVTWLPALKAGVSYVF